MLDSPTDDSSWPRRFGHQSLLEPYRFLSCVGDCGRSNRVNVVTRQALRAQGRDDIGGGGVQLDPEFPSTERPRRSHVFTSLANNRE